MFLWFVFIPSFCLPSNFSSVAQHKGKKVDQPLLGKNKLRNIWVNILPNSWVNVGLGKDYTTIVLRREHGCFGGKVIFYTF